MAKVQLVRDSQKKVVEAYEAEVDSLIRVNKDTLSIEDMLKVVEKLKEAIGIKKKIEEESNREVENEVRDRKHIVNAKILKTLRMVVAHMNLSDGRGKIELEKAVGESSKLLDVLAQTNRMLSWKVKATAGSGD